jgi:hypothetical protein
VPRITPRGSYDTAATRRVPEAAGCLLQAARGRRRSAVTQCQHMKCRA